MPRYTHKRPAAAPTSSIQFDAGVSDRKPTAAKSAGTLGKWGVTSFTSIRSSIVNGSARAGQDSAGDGRVASPPAPPADPFSFESNTPGAAPPVRKVKKFFKSRNAAPAVAGAAEPRRQLPMTRPPPPPPAPPPDDLQNVASPPEEKEEPESKRFFSSPAVSLPLRDSTTTRANSLSPREPPPAPQVPKMPPLKLRISRDKDTGDLTAVSGPPAADGGGGGGRRRRQPAAAAPQPPKAPRYRSPPPARAASPDPPPPPPPEEEGGGRAVRRTRRAAALEARERVAKTVQYGEDEEEEAAPPPALAARGRRAQRRRSSASDPPAAPAAAPAAASAGSPASAASPSAVANGSPAAESDGDSADDAAPPEPEGPATVEPPAARLSGPTAEPEAEPAAAAAALTPAPIPPPVLTPAPNMAAAVQPSAQPSVQPPAQPPAQPPVKPPIQPPVQPPLQPAVQLPVQPPGPPPLQPPIQPRAQSPLHTPVQPPHHAPVQPPVRPPVAPPPPAAAPLELGDPGSEPVNLSTRRPAADLERQLSSLFGEAPPAAPAPAPTAPAAPAAADSETTSRVYRKGIKDLGRYQRTQESSGGGGGGGGGGSPQRYADLESQLELLEAGRVPAAARTASPPAAPAPAPAHTSAAELESDPPPPLARANTEPVQLTTAAAAPQRTARSAAPAPAPAPAKTAAPAAEPRKGSIFKSRAGQGRTARARYNHRWTDDKDDTAPSAAAAAPAAAQNSDAPSALSALDFSDDPAPPAGGGGGGALSGRLTRVSTWHGSDLNSSQQPVTSVKCDRRAKEYYTVIQNVKKAYQIQEFGEYQEYNDDIEYIMDALQPTNSVSTRCLSATRLAGKCMVPAFRMHLRAHGTVTRFFAALADAPSDPCLSLCTSAVMFILSEDQLNMDLDKSSLELMLSLLDSDATTTAAESGEDSSELRKNRAKVRELCAQLQRQGQAKQLQLDNITASHLSMETLLSLTSQRAGAWFKEELRALGGLDRLLGTVSDSLRCLRQTPLLRRQRDTIARLNRCLRVVENVTSRNEENQQYLLQTGGGAALGTLSDLFQLAERELSDCTPRDCEEADGAARVLLEMTDTLMKVLVNLSSAGAASSCPAGGVLLGAQPGLLETVLRVVLRLPDRLPEQRQFDLLLLAMYLLMNLAESGAENRRRLVAAPAPPRAGQLVDVPAGAETAVAELLHMFYRLVRLATEVETHTDRILDGSVPAAPPAAASAAGQQDAGEVTATALIQKAGHHMEKTVIAAYIGVFAGHLAMDNPEYEMAVRSQLQAGRFTDVVEVLRKLLSFMDLTNTGRPETVHEMKTMRRVIDFMTAADQPAAAASSAAADGGELGALDMSL